MPKTAFNWHAVLMTAYWLHAVLMTAYSWHAVLMTAFDNLSHACSSIKSIQYTQFEQLTRTSQCLFWWRLPFLTQYLNTYSPSDLLLERLQRQLALCLSKQVRQTNTAAFSAEMIDIYESSPKQKANIHHRNKQANRKGEGEGDKYTEASRK